MTLNGTVVNGTIVLDEPAPLPDGTRVEINVKQPAGPEAEAKPTLAGLLKYAGCMKDLAPDFAAQHDHYLYGTPQR